LKLIILIAQVKLLKKFIGAHFKYAELLALYENNVVGDEERSGFYQQVINGSSAVRKATRSQIPKPAEVRKSQYVAPDLNRQPLIEPVRVSPDESSFDYSLFDQDERRSETYTLDQV